MVAASRGIASGRNEWRELTQAVRPCRSRETGARPAPRPNTEPVVLVAARFARSRPYRALGAGMRRLVRDTGSGDSTDRRGSDDGYRARPRRASRSAMRASVVRRAAASSSRRDLGRSMGRGFSLEPGLRRSTGGASLFEPPSSLDGLRSPPRGQGGPPRSQGRGTAAGLLRRAARRVRALRCAGSARRPPSRPTAAADIRPRAGETPASAERGSRPSGRTASTPPRQGCIHLALAALILLPGAARRDLQDEVRRLGLFPGLVRRCACAPARDHD